MLDRDHELRSRGGELVAEPFVRPRSAPPPVDREVPRVAVDADDRLPLPPPVTAALADTASIDVVRTHAEVERHALRDGRHVGRARFEHTGFLDAHGIDGAGWLPAHGANSSGFLEAKGAEAPGWLASLDARRLAAIRRGWNGDMRRDPS